MNAKWDITEITLLSDTKLTDKEIYEKLGGTHTFEAVKKKRQRVGFKKTRGRHKLNDVPIVEANVDYVNV
jgi:hypothetical protein